MNLLHRAVREFGADVLAQATFTRAPSRARCARARSSGVVSAGWCSASAAIDCTSSRAFRRRCSWPARAMYCRAQAGRSKSLARCSNPKPSRYSREAWCDAAGAAGARDGRVLRRSPAHDRFLPATCSRQSPCFRSERVVAFDAGEGTVLLLFQRGVSDQAFHTSGGVVPGHTSTGPAHFAFAIDKADVPHMARTAGDAAHCHREPRRLAARRAQHLLSRSRRTLGRAGHARHVGELLRLDLGSHVPAAISSHIGTGAGRPI